MKYTIQTTFGEVKHRQLFRFGEGVAARIYKRRNKSTAWGTDEVSHHVFTFESNVVVFVEA